MSRGFFIGVLCLIILGAFLALEFAVNNSELDALSSTLQLNLFAAGQPSALTLFYPPLAVLFFWFWSLLYAPFHLSFAGTWAVLLLTGFAGTLCWVNIALKNRGAVLLAPTVLIAAVLVHPRLLLARFDILLAFLILLAVLSAEAKQFRRCGFFLGCAILLKFVPIFLIPLFWFASTGFRNRLVEGMAWAFAFTAVFMTIFIKPLSFFENSISFLTYRTQTGFDLLSNASGIDIAIRRILGLPVQAGRYPEDALTIWNFDLPRELATMAVAAVAAGALIIAFQWYHKSAKVRRDVLLPTCVTFILFLLLTPTFSPHYLMWVVPLLVFWLLERAQTQGLLTLRQLSIGGLLFALCTLTQWVYPNHWYEFSMYQPLSAALMLTLRAGAMATLIVILWCEITGSCTDAHAIKQKKGAMGEKGLSDVDLQAY